MTVSALPACTFAEETSSEELLFMEIPSVTGVSKAKEAINETPMSVYTVSREELERWGVQQQFEIFGRVPGFAFYDFDYFGTEAMTVRGLRQVSRMGYSYDLLPIFDWGHQVFVPNFFQSVEIARGPAGLAWGSSAEGALINFNLRNDLEGNELVVQSGDNGKQVYSFAYGHQLTDKVGGDHIFIGYSSQQQGYKEFPANNIFASPTSTWRTYGQGPDTYGLFGVVEANKMKFVFVKTVNAQIGKLSQIGATGTLIDDIEDQLETRDGAGKVYQYFETLAYRLEYKALAVDNFNLSLYHNYCEKLFWVELFYQSRQIEKDWGFNGDWAMMNDKLSFNFGGDLLQQFMSDIPGFESTWVRTNYGYTAKDGGTFASQVAITSQKPVRNIFVQGKYSVNDRMKVILGGRADYKQDVASPQSETLFMGPRAAFVYLLNDDLSLKYCYNNTARRPAANELSGGVVKEEKLYSHEINAAYEIKNTIAADITLVTQKLTDVIGRNASLFGGYYNDGSVQADGLEWALKYFPVKTLLLYYNGSAYNLNASGGVVNTPGAVSSASALSDGSPLFVPKYSNFIGAELDVFGFMKANVDLRSYMDIAYRDTSAAEGKQSVSFVDATFRTKKFFKDSVSFSLIALNLLDENKGVPLLSEHAFTKNGLLPPKERRIMLQATLNFI